MKKVGVAAALAALLVAGAPAAEAKKVTCPSFTDGAGDVYDLWPYAGIPDDQVDVRRGEVAGDATRLAVQINLTALADVDRAAPAGRAYTVVLDIGTHGLQSGPFVGFSIDLDPLGRPTYSVGEFRDPESDDAAMDWAVPASGKVDLAHGWIRAWAPYSALRAKRIDVRRGTRVRRLWGEAARRVVSTSVTGLAMVVDTGRGEVRHALGGPACIPVGR